MRFLLAGVVALAAAGMVALSSAAQTASPQPATQQPAAQAAPQNPQQHSQVVFSRSTGESGQTTSQSGPAAPPPAVQLATEPSALDSERLALTFINLDLDVHLRTAEQNIAVRALLTVRNDGKAPLAHIPLQISSSLNWDRIRVAGKDESFSVSTLNSDADHTGQLHEAAVSLSQPLAPGAILQLDATYSGSIAASAQRLLAIGAPEDAALASDWDCIGVPFTGLRGFGNVVWYPVSSVPVVLGDGARLFDEIGEHKLRLSGARFRLRLTVEYPHGQAPTIALIDGHPSPLATTDASDPAQEVAGVATTDTGVTTLSFEAPSLFVAIRPPHPGPNLALFALPEDDPAVEAWTTAAAVVTPFLQSWLGQHPRSQLTLLDLPDPNDAPYETGSLLATPIHPASPDRLQSILVHALTHAYVRGAANSTQPPPAWLDEGVAQFLGTLWVEKQSGRDQALGMLEADRTALALAEPESPGQSTGQPLAQASTPVYYRTKAAYVLWMLRDIVGDPALSAALRAYDFAADAPGANSGHTSFEKLLELASHRDLAWFFADWVDADKGLPDLSIQSVFPSPESSGNWLVSVDVANSGYVSAEVPVTVRSASASVTQRLLVPARGNADQRILIQGKPIEVEVNDGTVPEIEASVHVTRLDQSADSSSQSNLPVSPRSRNPNPAKIRSAPHLLRQTYCDGLASRSQRPLPDVGQPRVISISTP